MLNLEPSIIRSEVEYWISKNQIDLLDIHKILYTVIWGFNDFSQSGDHKMDLSEMSFPQ